MKVTIYSEPKPIRKQNDLCLYIDKWCLIVKDQRSIDGIYSYETVDKICLIEGSIRIKDSLKEKYSNPAELYLREYSQIPEAFLYISQGSFIVVEYDKKTCEIILQRDLLGLKHAYYTKTSYGFCFSTSVSPLLEFRNGNNNINFQSLSYYLSFQYIPQPHSFFTEIKQLPLHGFIKYCNKHISVKLYDGSYSEVLMRHSAETLEDLGELLAESMNSQLIKGNNKVGAFLSGGMDTSSNVAILKSFLNIDPVVFTAGFKEQKYDETSYAKIVANTYGLRHHTFTITADVISSISDICALYDNPLADRAILPEYLICLKAREEGITQMVTGEGGDEVLGYPRNLPENIKLSQKFYENDNNLAYFYNEFSALLKKDIVFEIMQKSYLSSLDYLHDLYRDSPELHPFEKIYYGQWQMWMIDNVYMKDIQLFSHAGMGFISPYLDIALMKSFIRLDPQQKIDKLKNKKYLKKTMKEILPLKILNKVKHKFHVPIAEWLRKEIYEQVYEELSAKSSITSQYLNKKLVLQMLDKHKKGENDYNRPLWALFFLEQWYRLKKSYM